MQRSSANAPHQVGNTRRQYLVSIYLILLFDYYLRRRSVCRCLEDSSAPDLAVNIDTAVAPLVCSQRRGIALPFV